MDKSKAAPLTDKIDNQYLNKIYLEVTEELCKLHTQITELQTEVQRLKEITDELKNDDLPNVREWVSLTDEEIWEWFESNTAITRDGALRIARAIEAKLKEKNT